MLHEFLRDHRDELITRCHGKVSRRGASESPAVELALGIPPFLAQLTDALRAEVDAPRDGASAVPVEIGATAVKHGTELLLQGFTVDQVVHCYGDLCQAVTEMAAEQRVLISTDEFRTFNRCLDNAIADAVTGFGAQRDKVMSRLGAEAMNERLGSLAHEVRNLLNAAIFAFDAIKSGTVAVSGATGRVLDRSLSKLRDLIDRSISEVRVTSRIPVPRFPVRVADFVAELQASAALEAQTRGLTFEVPPIDEALVVMADHLLLGSAVSNLLLNAFKFSRRGGHVILRAHAVADRVHIEIEDECGGLANGAAESMFQPFSQQGNDRTGLGLGLSISRRAIEAHDGVLSVRDLPGRGCVFTIDLPSAPPE